MRRTLVAAAGMATLLATAGCGGGHDSGLLGSGSPTTASAGATATTAPRSTTSTSTIPANANGTSTTEAPTTTEVATTEAPTTAVPQGQGVPSASVPTVDTMPLAADYTPAVRPATIYLSGDSGNIATDLTWPGWDDKGATGDGTVDIQGCVPDCAQGSETPTPVIIYLNDPVDGAFTKLTEIIQGEPTMNFTLPTG